MFYLNFLKPSKAAEGQPPLNCLLTEKQILKMEFLTGKGQEFVDQPV